MWDTVQTNELHLSHAMPCQRCGHEIHTFLSCGDGCECQPAQLPGQLSGQAGRESVVLLLAG